MTGMVAAMGVVAEVDPTVQPVRESFYVFLFLAAMLVVILVSFLRHMKRAQRNLGSAKDPAAAPPLPSTPPGAGDDAR